MATPYLLIGGVPRMIKFIAQTGGVDDGFQEFDGLYLLGTVVYLFSLIPQQMFLPTLTCCLPSGLRCGW